MSEETTLDEKKPETPDADTSTDEEPKATEEQDQDKPENEDQEAENDEKTPQEKKHDRKFASNRISKQVERLNAEADVSTAETKRMEIELALEKEKNISRELEVRQPQPTAPIDPTGQEEIPFPDPDKYDLGIEDPGYFKEYNQYQKDVRAQENKALEERLTKKFQKHRNLETSARDINHRQREHYQRVDESGNDDYDATEEIAIKAVGKNVVKGVIDRFDDSDRLIYRIGKDVKLADKIREAKSNPDGVKALIDIARLLERASADVDFKPKTKTTPNPDQELPGGSPAEDDTFERKRRKILEKVQKTGDQKLYFDFMDKHRKEKAADPSNRGAW